MPKLGVDGMVADWSSKVAETYAAACREAELSPIPGEPEARFTTPVSNLFVAVAKETGLGHLSLIRETRLSTTRPDFAVLHTKAGKTIHQGFVELKARDVTVDTSQWRGRNASQWEKMKVEADIIIVCNGQEAQLYHQGEPKGRVAQLPFDDWANWDAENLQSLLERFLALKPTPIIRVSELSARLAVRTADLRDRILWLIDPEGGNVVAADEALKAWREHVYPQATARDFADGVSQVVAYGMVLAALSDEEADKVRDDHLSVAEARNSLRQFSPVLAAAFAPLIDKPGLFDAVKVELGALETLVSAIDAERVNAIADRRGDRWLSFYEDFLEVYDPDERRQAGVYYTPIDIVEAMTAMCETLLVDRFGKRLGFADQSVVTLDPATGTGTFPLAVIDRAVQSMASRRGAKTAGEQAAVNLGRNLFAFELLPGPYSVAHLRLSQRLKLLSNDRVEMANVILTDTLESPTDAPQRSAYWGDAETLAQEQQRAASVKLDQRVTVVIGNPPYRRVERDLKGRGSGGWVIDGTVPGRADDTQSLFDDILDIAKANTIFSHHASLYNLYVYFLRWAMWKAFEAHGEGPGIVSLITASSWLHGPGFVGLRQWVRETCDEAWVIDLGGDNKGANPEENVFAIETPVAIVILVRDGASEKQRHAPVHYRRIRGTKENKLATMRNIAASDNPFGGVWEDAPAGLLDPFVPSSGDAAWDDMPLITDLFPWQQPGCKFGRTWPIAPSEQLLRDRWTAFANAPAADRPGMFVTANSGRNIKTKVAGLKTLAEVTSIDPPQPIRRYAYRSFDRQYAFDDPRMANLERPSLWQSISDNQLFLAGFSTKPIGKGPALTASDCVPDLDAYCGRGGKDIIPLFRDAAATLPNMTDGLGKALGKRLGIAPPSVTDLAAYCYALLSASAYQERFAAALQTPGLHVPVTARPHLWKEAVEAGRRLLWLHSYAERFVDAKEDRPNAVPDVEGIEWIETVRTIPTDSSDIAYDAAAGVLAIGDGKLGGVREDVWTYSISGMQVLPKWLGYRTAKGAGRAPSSKSALDKIRPSEWADDWNDELIDLVSILTLTLDKQADLTDLLHRILTEPLIPASALPVPTKLARQPPATLRR